MIIASRRDFLAGLAGSTFFATGAARQAEGMLDDEKCQVVSKKVRYGEYFQYLPKLDAVGVLVVVHGQPAGDDIKNIPALARRFLERWSSFAEDHRLIALAPVFDAENFDSVVGNNGGGYRGLFGRQIGADAYVNGIVDPYKTVVKAADGKPWDGRFLLYGHSAGAQFGSRYVVIHPNRIRAAVLSAAGWYAMPDASAPWPSGMAPLRTTFRWGPAQEPQAINVNPKPDGWLKAAELPVTVVVGSADTESQKIRPGHSEITRVGRAGEWVNSMNRLAERRRKRGGLNLVVVDGVGHDSAKLTPAAMEALAKVLKDG